MSVIASRRLVDALSQAGCTVYVLHDFDKSGFSIFETLRRDTARYTYAQRPKVVDLGLRLEDVQAMGLQEEVVVYDKGVNPRINLAQNGATPEEQAFLVRRYREERWVGARVELNAMTSVQFVDWLESKLDAHQVTKVLPSAAALATAYRSQVQTAHLQQALDTARATLPDPASIAIPPDLRDAVEAQLVDSALPWDIVLWSIVQECQRTGQG